MSSTVVCSYPRSRNSRKAAPTSASRMGGFAAAAASAFSPRRGAALLELMDGNVAPGRLLWHSVQRVEGTECSVPTGAADAELLARRPRIPSRGMPQVPAQGTEGEQRADTARPGLASEQAAFGTDSCAAPTPHR